MSDGHVVAEVISGKRATTPICTGRNGTFREGAERRDCPQEALESELLAKMETLKNVHESWMLDQDVAARRTRQERGAITDPLHTFKEADCSVCR